MDAAWKRRRLAAARGPLGTLLAKLLRKLRSAGTIGKIVLGNFQVLHAFSQLPSVRWPARFAAFLERLSLFSFQLFSAYPLSCVLDGDVSFVHQLLGTLLLPIIGAALVLLLALLAFHIPIDPKLRLPRVPLDLHLFRAYRDATRSKWPPW